MMKEIMLAAYEPEVREQILLLLPSTILTEILGYSATKQDAARAIATNPHHFYTMSIHIEWNEPF